MHDRRDQHGADEQGVDEDRDGHAQADHLDGAVGGDHERGEDHDHDGGRGADGPAGDRLADPDGGVVIPQPQPFLVHAADQEHLVVHGEPEEHREHQDRHQRGDRPGVGHPDQPVEPAELEHRDDDPERGGGREQVHDRRRGRDDQATEQDHQQDERQGHDHDDEQRELGR